MPVDLDFVLRATIGRREFGPEGQDVAASCSTIPLLSSTPLMNSHKLWNSSNLMIACFGVFMLVGLMFLAWLGSPPQVVAEGKPLPIMDLQPLIGTEDSPSVESLRGKLAVIHFWGTWCPPCVAEYPEFAQLAKHFADDARVKVLSVSCSSGPEYDVNALRDKTQAFMEERQAVLPTYCDPAAMTRGKLALIMPNGAFSYPTTLLVDRDGVIIESLAGSAHGDMAALESMIEKLLEQ